MHFFKWKWKSLKEEKEALATEAGSEPQKQAVKAQSKNSAAGESTLHGEIAST
ncbi:hypothetical protein O9992_07755 [Vibrio lentus]|nr:hypothetical protein [Vibrio lentus]